MNNDPTGDSKWRNAGLAIYTFVKDRPLVQGILLGLVGTLLMQLVIRLVL